MTVYIPSYFKNYEERKILFKKCVDSYLKLGHTIVVVWMNTEEDKVIDNRITYIDHEVVNASVARNIMLDLFYDSDDNYAIFSDDDVILNSLNDLKGLKQDAISLVNDKRKRIIETAKISSSILFMNNLNKKYNKKIYFDEALSSNQDLDFGINLERNGIKVITLNTTGIILNKEKSVMFDNVMQKIKRKEDTLNKIIKKWNYKWQQ